MRIRDVLTTSGMTDGRAVPQELPMEDVIVQRVLALEATDSAADSAVNPAANSPPQAGVRMRDAA